VKRGTDFEDDVVLLFWDSFSCLLVISGVGHVCMFHVKETFSPPKHAILSKHKQRCQRAQEKSQEVLIRVFFFLNPLTSLILAPGVVYRTVSNSATAFQSTFSVMRSGKSRVVYEMSSCLQSITLQLSKSVTHTDELRDTQRGRTQLL